MKLLFILSSPPDVFPVVGGVLLCSAEELFLRVLADSWLSFSASSSVRMMLPRIDSSLDTN
jgi:hypothetical protein